MGDFDADLHLLLAFVFLRIPEDDVRFVELTQFKEQFKAHLRELAKPVRCARVPAQKRH